MSMHGKLNVITNYVVGREILNTNLIVIDINNILKYIHNTHTHKINSAHTILLHGVVYTIQLLYMCY